MNHSWDLLLATNYGGPSSVQKNALFLPKTYGAGEMHKTSDHLFWNQIQARLARKQRKHGVFLRFFFALSKVNKFFLRLLWGKTSWRVFFHSLDLFLQRLRAEILINDVQLSAKVIVRIWISKSQHQESTGKKRKTLSNLKLNRDFFQIWRVLM